MNEGVTWPIVVGFCQLVLIPFLVNAATAVRQTGKRLDGMEINIHKRIDEVIKKLEEACVDIRKINGRVGRMEEWRESFASLQQERHEENVRVHNNMSKDVDRLRDGVHGVVNRLAAAQLKEEARELQERHKERERRRRENDE